MESKRGLHITIVENKTGETLDEFDTKGIVYVHLNEVSDEDAAAEEGQAAVHGIGIGQKMEHVNQFERLSLLEGLQILIQNMQEDDPMLQLLMMITKTERKSNNRD